MTAAHARTDEEHEAALFTLPQGSPPELMTAIEDAVRAAHARYGLSAFEMSREAAVMHEVGHTIVGTHEGLIIESVRIFSRSVPLFGRIWGGWCAEPDGTQWTTGPDTSAESDLRRARTIIGGLAGEALTGTDKPGSSLDELALSQLVGLNAATKLDDDPSRSDEDYDAYAQRFWRERVWNAAVAILQANREPFTRLANELHQTEMINGAKLRMLLAEVRRIAP